MKSYRRGRAVARQVIKELLSLVELVHDPRDLQVVVEAVEQGPTEYGSGASTRIIASEV